SAGGGAKAGELTVGTVGCELRFKVGQPRGDRVRRGARGVTVRGEECDVEARAEGGKRIVETVGRSSGDGRPSCGGTSREQNEAGEENQEEKYGGGGRWERGPHRGGKAG